MPIKKFAILGFFTLYVSFNLAGQNIWVSKNPYGSERAVQVGDVVTVIVDESWQSNYFFEQDRDDKVTIKTLPDKEVMKFLSGADSVKNITSRKKGKISGGNKLKGSLSVLVNSANNDGTFQIGGAKFITLDGESNSIQLRGIIHPRDLQDGYKIRSDRIANLVMNFQGKIVKKRFQLGNLSLRGTDVTAGGTPDTRTGIGAEQFRLSEEQRRLILQNYIEEILGEFLDQNLRP